MDALCTSLSKSFNGCGDALGGSVVLNSLGSRYLQLSSLLAEMQGVSSGNNESNISNGVVIEDIAVLFADDALVMDRNSR